MILTGNEANNNMMDRNKTGMLFFVGSESFFFISLMIAFVYYGLPHADLSVKYMDVPRTAIFTVLLLSSSVTMSLAGRMMKKGKRNLHVIFLAVTFLLGLIFIFGQGMEYAKLFKLNMPKSRKNIPSAAVRGQYVNSGISRGNAG